MRISAKKLRGLSEGVISLISTGLCKDTSYVCYGISPKVYWKSHS
jgi:hypothetical protein